MKYKNIPVKPETYDRLRREVIDKEKWDETINRLITAYENRRRALDG